MSDQTLSDGYITCPCNVSITVPEKTEMVSPIFCFCGRAYYYLDGSLTCDTSGCVHVKPNVHRVTRMSALSTICDPGVPVLNAPLHEGANISLDKTRIIGVAGYRGSGKDTVARLITGRFPALSGMRRIAYADTLRDAVKAMYGFTYEQMLDPVLKEQVDPFWGISPRDALRLVGTDCMRSVARQDFWLRALERRMQQIRARSLFPVKGYVIPDVRFENELAHIRAQGGEVWVIYRPGCEFDGHVTEELPQERGRFDRVIENNGTVRDLRRQVRALLTLHDAQRVRL